MKCGYFEEFINKTCLSYICLVSLYAVLMALIENVMSIVMIIEEKTYIHVCPNVTGFVFY